MSGKNDDGRAVSTTDANAKPVVAGGAPKCSAHEENSSLSFLTTTS